MYNIVCLKYGTKYSSEYVNVLHNMTRRFCSLPFRFICFTDDFSGIDEKIECAPLPCKMQNVHGWWHKISLFQENVLDLRGLILFLDLDIVIINMIDKFFEYPGDFLAIWDWIHGPSNNVFNSSVMRWAIGEQTHVWENFARDHEKIMEKYHGDQDYISSCSNLIPWPKDWCISYKWQEGWHQVKRETSIVVFHGNPNPHEAISGTEEYPPAPWIRNFWR